MLSIAYSLTITNGLPCSSLIICAVFWVSVLLLLLLPLQGLLVPFDISSSVVILVSYFRRLPHGGRLTHSHLEQGACLAGLQDEGVGILGSET